MTVQLRVILAGLLIFNTEINAQSNDIQKTLEQLDTAANQLKSIFKKKNTGNKENTKVDSSKNNEIGLANRSMKVKISETVKILNVDEFFPFNNGAAVIRKGNTTALINYNGEFLVPFGKYDFDVSNQAYNSPVIISGLFLLKDRRGAVNYKGQYFPTPFYEISEAEHKYNYEFAQAASSLDEYIEFMDKEGKKYKITSPPDWNKPGFTMIFSEGLASVRDRGTQKYGYKNPQNIYVIPPIYDEAEIFSEGAAVVGKINEYGEMKYWFIDKKGRKITDLNFSLKPNRFSSGRAKVYPKDKTDFSYGFINSKGNLVVKITQSFNNTRLGNSAEFGDYYFGYSFQIDRENTRLLDTTGKEISNASFLKSFGLKSAYPNYFDPYCQCRNDGILTFSFNNSSLVGFIDLKNKNIILPFFDHLRYEEDLNNRGKLDIKRLFLFDDVSGLTLTSQFIEYDEKNRKNKYIEGYMNRNGEFVIIKGEESKW